MAEPKTKATDASVAAFLDAIPDPTMRADSRTVVAVLQRVTKAKPKMWGKNIIGFGDYRYQNASGKDVDWMLVGFSPRKAALTLYGMGGMARQAAFAKTLGKHTTGGGCLYIKRLADVDVKVLEQLVKESVGRLARRGATA